VPKERGTPLKNSVLVGRGVQRRAHSHRKTMVKDKREVARDSDSPIDLHSFPRYLRSDPELMEV
jgi:hypothetical protein